MQIIDRNTPESPASGLLALHQQGFQLVAVLHHAFGDIAFMIALDGLQVVQIIHHGAARLAEAAAGWGIGTVMICWQLGHATDCPKQVSS